MPAHAPSRETPLAILAELPAGFDWERSAVEIVARRSALAPTLDAAGFALGREARVRPSGLAGRRPLHELECAGERLLLRRMSHGGLLRWLSGERFLDPERPFRELVCAARLRAAGVPTPEIVAARARRLAPLGWRLELVSRRVEGAQDLGLVLREDLEHGRAPHARRALLSAAGRLVRALHEAGYAHPDLHPGNLLALDARSEGGGEPRLWVLDLDRGAFRAHLDRRERVRALARLWRWCARAARRAGRPAPALAAGRFLRSYEPERATRLELWRAIRARSRRDAPAHALGRALERLFGG